MVVGVIRALWVDYYFECVPKTQRAKLVGTTMQDRKQTCRIGRYNHAGRLRDRKQTKYSQKIIYGSG